MENFKKLWEPIDRVIFGIVKHLCVLMLAALVAVVFYIFVGRYFSSSVSHVGRAPVSVFADMDEYAGIFLSASDG